MSKPFLIEICFIISDLCCTVCLVSYYLCFFSTEGSQKFIGVATLFELAEYTEANKNWSLWNNKFLGYRFTSDFVVYWFLPPFLFIYFDKLITKRNVTISWKLNWNSLIDEYYYIVVTTYNWAIASSQSEGGYKRV